MKKAALSKRQGYLIMGGGGLVAAAVYLGFSVRLPFGEMDQPGAAVFPVMVGVTLIIASLAVLWEGWHMDKGDEVAMPAGTDIRRVLILVGLLLGYLLTLPVLGQIIGSLLFCLLLMRALTRLGWMRIAAYSFMISIGLYVIFVRLLQVPLPQGIGGF
jgi:putative tricarboxylic transport membrane protein